MRWSLGRALRQARPQTQSGPSTQGWAVAERGAASVAAAGVPQEVIARPRAPPRRWDLPRETAFKLPTRVDSSLGTEAEKKRAAVRLDAISSDDVSSQWPPADLVADALQHAPVKRPHLWLNGRGEDPPNVGVEDAGRFLRVSRDDLIDLLPEGACGELSRDLTLIPSRNRDVGIMLRKPAIELIYQLSRLRDATDSRGQLRIRKAGFLLDGKKGTGKSLTLNTVAMWARRNGWLVVMEPVPSRYAKEVADIKRSNAGVYIQNEFAQDFLEMTSNANRELFEDIPVDLSSYGSRGIDGEPIKETRRLYEPLIEKTVDQEVADKGLSAVERLHRIAAYKKQVRMPSMAEHLSRPANLWEIVEFGLQNQPYACQAVSELFVQLQQQTRHPVLVMVDEWNECFPVSEYVSIRYDNTRFHGYIPAYHLTMPRAFHRWDGHLYKRGLKICATSWMRFKRRDYRPELLGVKDHEIRTVRNFTPHEFANFVTYYRLMNVLHNFPREDLEYYYMLTQGNGWQARRVLTTLY